MVTIGIVIHLIHVIFDIALLLGQNDELVGCVCALMAHFMVYPNDNIL